MQVSMGVAEASPKVVEAFWKLPPTFMITANNAPDPVCPGGVCINGDGSVLLGPRNKC